MEMPSSENDEHPTVICNEAAEHPTIISNDAAEHPTISNDAAEHPITSNDDVEHPTISNDAEEHPTIISYDADNHHEDMVPNVLNHGSMEPNHEIAEEEVKQTLEAIASTGKWHDWEKLRSMVSFQLKQILLEYPEAKINVEQQSASLGETFEELEQRLDEALFSFVEGPPFTLQRLCEILLAARSIYPKLSKLALALEKNLLVTSTLPISTGTFAQTTAQKSDAPTKLNELHLHSNLVQNGIEPVVGDRDEIMAEADEVAVIDIVMPTKLGALEGVVGSSETDSTAGQ